MELVDMRLLNSRAIRRVGSTPTSTTGITQRAIPWYDTSYLKHDTLSRAANLRDWL